MTSVRDRYIQLLEKRAAEAVAPDYSVDSQEEANKELASNKSEQRSDISSLLSAAKKTETADTKQMGQLLPQAKKDSDTTASSPMLKVAMQAAFFEGLRKTDLLKEAEIPYIRTAFRSYEDELEKIGGWIGTQGTVLKSGLTKMKPRHLKGAEDLEKWVKARQLARKAAPVTK